MASEVSICNDALQILGVARIVELSEDSRNARAVNACYTTVRDAELETHPWGFARKRVTLVADVDAPDNGYDYQYTLPSDCLRVVLPLEHELDWVVEDGRILTDDSGSIEISYVKRVTDANAMPASFRRALSASIAEQTCEELTGSTTKIQAAQAKYLYAIAQARKSNAFQQTVQHMDMSPWEAARR